MIDIYFPSAACTLTEFSSYAAGTLIHLLVVYKTIIKHKFHFSTNQKFLYLVEHTRLAFFLPVFTLFINCVHVWHLSHS